MADRIVLHAGFHKTGTTTIQKAMMTNRRLLRRKGIHAVTRDGMIGLCEAARAWSQSRAALDQGLVTYEAAECAVEWAKRDGSVLVSSEDLSGHMPGRRGLTSYDACPKLMRIILDALRSVSSRTDIIFAFTTRAAEPWLRSCHAQHVRATRLRLDADTYAKTYARSARLIDVVAQVEQAVAPHQVVALPIEDHSENPLRPLAALAGLRPAAQNRLEHVPPANIRPDAQRLKSLLDLNRSDLSKSALQAAKKNHGADRE